MRERARRNVRAEPVLPAQELFADRGYAETTVEKTAAGMSKRTFFRYVSSEEDLVVGRCETIGAAFSCLLAARAVWISSEGTLLDAAMDAPSRRSEPTGGWWVGDRGTPAS
ncbi:TetR family transcriptional regulator [Streptosporangium sp. NPDC001559]|uniref:TetR family transcriptional regulator n=1 Tax=Streptosporangium sp. NPDC001559 TaxID=3366187 RepID=UPI0036E21FE7